MTWTVLLKVKKGVLYKVDSIRQLGNAKMSNKFLQRYLSISNGSLYNKTKFAYSALYKSQNGDASDIDKIDPALKNLSIGSVQSYRNIFRRDRDYSILWFVLGWGLNVVDATVSGHLKEFDVNSNLSLRIEPVIQPQMRQAGFSLQFNLKNSHAK